jgi:hypothetical protein
MRSAKRYVFRLVLSLDQPAKLICPVSRPRRTLTAWRPGKPKGLRRRESRVS